MKQKYKFFFKRLFYYFYGEKFFKRLNYDWSKKPSRIEIIQNIINREKYKSYLEIGCDGDDSFSKIRVENKVGVDPYSGGNFRGTSDYFFSINNNKFDCIFIDGLHEYSQVYKDINSHNELQR